MAKERIRVCVVEDHPVIREGIVRLLQRENDMELVGQYGEALSAIRDIPSMRPHVVATNVGIPGLDGLEFCRRLSKEHPDVRVLMLTLDSEPDTILSAFRDGARGYLLKECADEFCQAIRTIVGGEFYVCQALPGEIRRQVESVLTGMGHSKPASPPSA